LRANYFEMFSRPDGADSVCDIYPQLKLRAIFGLSLRDADARRAGDGEYMKPFLAEARGKQKQEAAELHQSIGFSDASEIVGIVFCPSP
jgi:hypothetical protein